ncbi:MAG: Isoquinoline 1-oxidoreductase subunit [Pseudomonadota bacterium]
MRNFIGWRFAVTAAAVALAFWQDRPATAEEDKAASVDAFLELAPVLQHPRCVNCHPKGESPLIGDDGRAHLPRVVRGPDGHGQGLKCTVCHGPQNNPGTGAPGAPNWHLAPASMGWEGLSVPEICAALTDPEMNGGKTPEQVAVHMAEDPLVAWAWDPGMRPGRRERSVPPVDLETFGALARAWAASGAHCPTDADLAAAAEVAEPEAPAEDG